MELKKPNYFKLMLLTTLVHILSDEKSKLIEFLLEYERIIKSKYEKDGHRIKFTDSERTRLAKKGVKFQESCFCKFQN